MFWCNLFCSRILSFFCDIYENISEDNFEESNMIVEIDEDDFPIDASTIMHIPLGSDHGARVEAPYHMHYLWMDFVIDEDGNQYLKDAHQIIDE